MNTQNWKNEYRKGQTIYRAGCFTFEGYIVNQNLDSIAYRLGLPQRPVEHGVYIAYALSIPNIDEFELGGTTLDATDRFVDYSGRKPIYDAQKFADLYTKGAAVPVHFESIKKQYHKIFSVNKLVKIIAPQADYYPPGTMVPQFFMTGFLPCNVTAFIPPKGSFIV